jgi:hypothetical protein
MSPLSIKPFNLLSPIFAFFKIFLPPGKKPGRAKSQGGLIFGQESALILNKGAGKEKGENDEYGIGDAGFTGTGKRENECDGS